MPHLKIWVRNKRASPNEVNMVFSFSNYTLMAENFVLLGLCGFIPMIYASSITLALCLWTWSIIARLLSWKSVFDFVREPQLEPRRHLKVLSYIHTTSTYLHTYT